MTNLIVDGVKDFDDIFAFKIGDISFDVNKLPILPVRDIQYYDQTEHTPATSACTIVNAFRQRCHRVDKAFTDEEMVRVINYCVVKGYVIGQGWSTAEAMNAVLKYVTEYYTEYKTDYAIIDASDSNIPKILTKNHSLGFTYRGNSKWDTDRKDGILEGTLYKPTSYGHRTIIKWDIGMTVDDSFSIKNYKITNFGKLVNGINIYPNLYIWLVDTNLNTEQVKKYTKWKVMLESNIANNSVMISDPRRGTTDKTFKSLLIKDNNLLTTKLNFIKSELKKEGL